jgi:hypothetical protein
VISTRSDAPQPAGAASQLSSRRARAITRFNPSGMPARL